MLEELNRVLWGPLGVGLLGAAGLWLTVRTGWFQLRQARLWLGQTLGALLAGSPELDRQGGDSISPLQSLCTALGATIGAGSVLGVGAAIASGGPGAVFWMWVMALFGMMTAYAENLLGLAYRRRQGGMWQGGPMYYLSEGLGARPGCKSLGRALAGLFAGLCVLASLGMGNLSQVNAMAAALQGAFGTPPPLTGAVVALATGVLLWRGLKGVAAAAGRLVPLMAAFYLAGALLVVGLHAARLPAALEAIVRGAFGLRAAGGGLVGCGVWEAVRWGFARGCFSSEAGLGSSAIASGSASTPEPVQQGMWGMFQVFVSTFVVCTLTALAILTAGLVDLDTGRVAFSAPVEQLAGAAFASAFGPLGPVFLGVTVALFAWSSILGWSQYGAACWTYLLGPDSLWIYKLVFLALTAAGACADFTLALALADAVNGLMMLPNLAGLFALSGEVARRTRRYLEEKRTAP